VIILSQVTRGPGAKKKSQEGDGTPDEKAPPGRTGKIEIKSCKRKANGNPDPGEKVWQAEWQALSSVEVFSTGRKGALGDQAPHRDALRETEPLDYRLIDFIDRDQPQALPVVNLAGPLVTRTTGHRMGDYQIGRAERAVSRRMSRPKNPDNRGLAGGGQVQGTSVSADE